MRKYIHTILCAGAMFILASCGHAEAEIQPEKVEVVEIATEGEKVAEIVTERVSEATEASTEIVTTEEKTESPGKIVFSSERKVTDRVLQCEK